MEHPIYEETKAGVQFHAFMEPLAHMGDVSVDGYFKQEPKVDDVVTLEHLGHQYRYRITAISTIYGTHSDGGRGACVKATFVERVPYSQERLLARIEKDAKTIDVLGKRLYDMGYYAQPGRPLARPAVDSL